MIKRLWIVLLVLTFMLGSVSSFWSKPGLANTGEERRVMLCAAEPWNDWWDKATPPSPPPVQNSTYSPTYPTKIESKPRIERQKTQQKPQRSFWFSFQFLLSHFKLVFNAK